MITTVSTVSTMGTITLAMKFLSEVIEVLRLSVVPGENLVGFVLGNDFLLNESCKSGLNGVVVDRGHHAGVPALAPTKTLKPVHHFWARIFPGVDLIGLFLGDHTLCNKLCELFILFCVSVLVPGGLHRRVEVFTVDSQNLGDPVFDGISRVAVARAFLCKGGPRDGKGPNESCARTEHDLSLHFSIPLSGGPEEMIACYQS
jgi:hypothetical protein